MAAKKSTVVPPAPQNHPGDIIGPADALNMALLDLDALLAGISALTEYDGNDNHESHILYFADLARGRVQSARQAAEQLYAAKKEG
jgi:hypothetical protein